MSLWSQYCDAPNVGMGQTRPCHKYTHYPQIYERHFGPWQGRSLVFWEIGIQDGGSLQLWKRYFGNMARIIGLDINPDYAANGSPGVEIRIGNQSDSAFLASVIAEFGVPDIVLDDGSHIQSDMRATFEFVYPQMPRNGLYVLEDLHVSYWSDFGGGIHVPESVINVAKGHVDELNAGQKSIRAQHPPPYLPDIGVPEGPDPSGLTANTMAIHFYPDIVVYERGTVLTKETR